MIVKLDDAIINMDKVIAITLEYIDEEYALNVQFERGQGLTLYYNTKKEALNELDRIYNQVR